MKLDLSTIHGLAVATGGTAYVAAHVAAHSIGLILGILAPTLVPILLPLMPTLSAALSAGLVMIISREAPALSPLAKEIVPILIKAIGEVLTAKVEPETRITSGGLTDYLSPIADDIRKGMIGGD